MNTMRRKLCQSLAALLGPLGLGACSQPAPQKPQRTYTAQEQQLLDKFRGIGGFEFVTSGFGRTADEGFFIRIKDGAGNRLMGGSAWEKGTSTSTYSLRPLDLKILYVEAYTSQDQGRNKELLYRKEVPVAERIPDDLLDDLRRVPKGGLRIKLRFHHDGVLLGWDIERRPGFDPRKRDKFGEAVYVAPVHSFAGGDFREARIFNGKPERMGWYIDPKTGRKIETDF